MNAPFDVGESHNEPAEAVDCCSQHPGGVCPYAKLGVACPYRAAVSPDSISIGAKDSFTWKQGDEIPEHLRPAPGELPTEPAPSPWPQIVPIASTEPDETITRAWPKSTFPEAAPEREAWETVATRNDAQDGYRYREATDDGLSEDCIHGVSAGFVCRVCGYEAKQFEFHDGEPAARDACSPECQYAIHIVLDEWDSTMADHNLTGMERKAVKDTRNAIYHALIAAGIVTAEQLDALAAQGVVSAEKFDELILTIWGGVRKSMQDQSANGEIPF